MAYIHAGVDADRIILCNIGCRPGHAIGRGNFLGHLSAAGDRNHDSAVRSRGRIFLARGMQYDQKQAALIFCQSRGIIQRP